MNSKRKKEKNRRVTGELTKRLDAIEEHVHNSREAIKEGKYRTVVDELRKARRYTQSAELDAIDLRDMESQDQVEHVIFYGIDGFGRPIFRSLENKNNYYGCTYQLFDRVDERLVLSKLTEADLVFFGNCFGCEPMGTRADVRILVNENRVYNDAVRLFLKEGAAAFVSSEDDHALIN
jgi:hypothetical protein